MSDKKSDKKTTKKKAAKDQPKQAKPKMTDKQRLTELLSKPQVTVDDDTVNVYAGNDGAVVIRVVCEDEGQAKVEAKAWRKFLKEAHAAIKTEVIEAHEGVTK